MAIIIWLHFILILCVSFSIGQKLEKQLESNTHCYNDEDCMEMSKNSICIGNTVDTQGICYCKKEFITQKNRTHFECLSKAEKINDLCVKDVQCQVPFGNYAICENGRCVCKNGCHFYGTNCYETIKLDETCTFTQQCLLKNGSVATCLDGKCVCGLFEHPVHMPDGESCEINAYLGDDCKKDEECLSENSRCETVCRCKPGYSTSEDGKNCLKAVDKLEDYCQEDSQCEHINNAFCEQYRCLCRNGFHMYKGACIKSVKLNDTCSQTAECWIYPTLTKTNICRDGICTCKERYSADGRTCMISGVKSLRSFNVIIVIAFYILCGSVFFLRI